MYRRLARNMIRRSFAEVSEGRFDRVSNRVTADVEHSFPGDHPLGGQRKGREALQAWFRRFERLFPGHVFDVQEVVVAGWPWRSVVAVHWEVQITPVTGEPYTNQGTTWLELRWGRIAAIHEHTDSQRVARACEQLSTAGVEEATAPPITGSMELTNSTTPRWSVRRRLIHLSHRFYAAAMDKRATEIVQAPAVGDLGTLQTARHCLVVTYRRDGRPVPTPVWFGLDQGHVYFRAEGGSGKLKRIANDPHVLIAPCTPRGRPTGPPMTGTARILGNKSVLAERAIQRNFGLARRLYERWFTLPDGAYVEVRADPMDP